VNRRGALRLLAGGSVAALAVAQAPLAFARAGAPLYKNPQAPIPARVADLMARMTLAEKVAQLRGVWAGKGAMLSGLDFDSAKASANFPDGIGALGRPSDKRGTPGVGQASGGSADRWRTPRQTVEFINALQNGRWRPPGWASRCWSTRNRCTATGRRRRPASRRRSPWPAPSTPPWSAESTP
jgi:beta-glucosidase